MRSLLQKVYFHNTVRDYLICLVASLIIVLFRKLLSRSIATVSLRMLKRTAWNIDEKSFINLLAGPLQLFFILVITFLAFDNMRLPPALNIRVYHLRLKEVLGAIGIGLLILAFVWLLLRTIDFIAILLQRKADLNPAVSDHQLVVFFKDFFKVIIVLIGVLLLIRFTLHKSIGTLLAGFGIVGAAVALSARESLENLIASFIIFFDKPFAHGDLVKVQNITGTVERIGLRSTRIRTDQKTYVTVPNKQMVDTILDNLSLRTQRKVSLSLEISAATPYDTVNKLVLAIDNILLKRKDYVQTYSVVLTDIKTNTFIIQVDYYTGAVAIDIYNDVRQEINLSIIQVMEQMKIKLAGKETEIRFTSAS
jgi:MscS family membrane protein